MRAVWLTTAAGLDWPSSLNPVQQQEDLLEILTALREHNFNTIFFQVRARGDAYYQSSYEPWAANLGGALGANPGWDPLAFLVDHAHGAGLEVHAWFNLYKVSGPGFPESSRPQHVARAKPQWVYSYEGEVWLNAGMPEVNDYLSKVAMELVRNYDIDGIQFDFVRYPGKNVPDQAEYAAYRDSLSLGDWRRRNINRFLESFYAGVMREKPWVKVGATPVGNFPADGPPTALGEMYQDAPGWLRNGSVDYIVPQIYWSLGSSPADPDFALLARNWASVASGRHVYAGIAPYKKEILAELPSQIDSARVSGCLGQAFFRYGSLDFRQLRGRYDVPASVPTMPWKDINPPSPPDRVAVTESDNGIYLLEWKRPPEAEGTSREYRYRIYRSSGDSVAFGDPATLVHTTEPGIRYYSDTLRGPMTKVHLYSVAAIDRYGRIGRPSSPVSTLPAGLRTMMEVLTPPVSLSALVDSTDGDILVAYRIPEAMAVTLLLQQDARTTSNPLVETIVGERKEQGTYFVRVSTGSYPPGRYFVVLKAGGATINRPVGLP